MLRPMWSSLVLTLGLGLSAHLPACGDGGDAPGDASDASAADLGSADSQAADAGVDGVPDVGPDTTTPDDATLTDTPIGDASPDSSSPGAPRFSGLAQLYAPASNTLRLVWIAAEDDTTAPSAIAYEIYHGSPDAGPLDARLGTPDLTVTGVTTADLTGLTGPTDVLVVARDEDGQRSEGRVVHRLDVPDRVVTAHAAVHELAALGITATELGEGRFSLTGPADALAPGDLILVPNAFGRHLRRITAVTGVAPRLIDTEPADLSAVFADGALRFGAVLAEPPPASGPAPAGALFVPDPDAPRHYHDPATGLALSAEDHAVTILWPPPRVPKSISLGGGATLTHAIRFEPRLEGEALWGPTLFSGPEKIRLVAVGELSVEALAALNFEGEGKVENEVELYTRTMRLRYLIGGVPVLQSVTLRLMGTLELEVGASFTASAGFKAKKDLQVGVEYTRAGGFRAVKEEGFEHEVSFELGSGATMKGKLTVHPVLETALYEAVSVGIEVRPTLTLDAHARFIPPPAELTRADVDFAVEAQVKANLSIFGAELAKWEGETHKLLAIPIHSLPEVRIVGPDRWTTCSPARFQLAVTDGVNNKVVSEHIDWTIDTLFESEIDEGGMRASVGSTVPGPARVRVAVHGDGILGAAGTRYAEHRVEFADPPWDCEDEPETGPDDAGGAFPGCGGLALAVTGAPVFNKTRYTLDDLRIFEGDDGLCLKIPLNRDYYSPGYPYWQFGYGVVVMAKADLGQPLNPPPNSYLPVPRWTVLMASDSYIPPVPDPDAFGEPSAVCLKVYDIDLGDPDLADLLALWGDLVIFPNYFKYEVWTHDPWQYHYEAHHEEVLRLEALELNATAACPTELHSNLWPYGCHRLEPGGVFSSQQRATWFGASSGPSDPGQVSYAGCPEYSWEMSLANLGQEWRNTGYPAPIATVVGTGPALDGNDDPREADPLPQRTRAVGTVQAHDRDHWDITPNGGPGGVDEPAFPSDDPDCVVVVEAEGDTAWHTGQIVIAVFDGLDAAEAGTGKVAEGFGSVSFRPIPTRTYYARFSTASQTPLGYTAEVQSRCTAPEPRPLLTGPPSLDSTEFTAPADVTVTLPINDAVTFVEVTGLDTVAGAGSSLYASADVAPGSSQIALPLSGLAGLPLGTPVLIAVKLYDGNGLTSYYHLDATFSATHYTRRPDEYSREGALTELPLARLTRR